VPRELDSVELRGLRSKGRLLNAFVFLAFCLLVAGITFFILQQMLHTEVARVEDDLVWTARETAWDIGQVLQERKLDAVATASQKGLAKRVIDYETGLDPLAGAFVQDRLDVDRRLHGYEAVVVFSGSGDALMWSGRLPTEQDAIVDHVRTAASDGGAVLVEAKPDESGWDVWWLHAMPPLPGETLVIGECIDIAPTIREVIDRHESAFSGGELVVIDQEHEDQIRSLCSEDDLSVSGSDECRGMRMLALGSLIGNEPAIVRGTDCDSGEAVGAVVVVPGTDWRVMAKMPESAAMDAVRGSHTLALGVNLMIFAIAGTTMISLQRGRERRAEQAHSLVEIRNALDSQDRFLANMSHELRTPLNSIMGFTSIMLGGMTGPLNDEQRKQLGMVDESSKRLLALVNDVLDLSRLKAGKQPVTVSEFTAAEVVADACGIMHPLTALRQLECGFTLPDEEIVLNTDREMVERVVLNLMSNAIKFTDEGYMSLDVAYEATSDTVSFVVRDSGCGISDPELARVMEEFTQVVEPSGFKPVGTGLGLAISRRMAEALGGSLMAVSKVGVGSTFTFTIPRCYQGDGEAVL